uniref:Insulin-like domain-containing protein n=1 Tax=Sinocyclocheilus anshuiensis TaxID=1608454 RepID=A0A671PP54_9TELE
MFRVFSAVLLVCVCVSAERPDLPRDFGVKLCGREFIRAVIFTCGGSRWRRSAQGPGTCSSSSAPEQHLHLLHLHHVCVCVRERESDVSPCLYKVSLN